MLASFWNLGELLPDGAGSRAVGVSADGSTPVGYAFGEAISQASVRWTQDGWANLGTITIPPDLALGGGFANAASIDGSVVVGFVGDDRLLIDRAFRWTEENGMNPLPSSTDSVAYDITPDGRVVVGFHGDDAAQWINGAGPIALTSPGEGSFFAEARGVSANGEVIVGLGDYPMRNGDETIHGNMALRWEGGSVTPLGDLPGGFSPFFSEATAISSDGSVIVGYSESALGYEAVRWRAGNEIESLGGLVGGSVYSRALGVSNGGSLIVGAANSDEGDEAVLWNSDGIQRVKDVLIDLGLDVSNWTLYEASAVTPDGSVIVGSGVDPNGRQSAWLADLGGAAVKSFTHDRVGDVPDLDVLAIDYRDPPAGEFDIVFEADNVQIQRVTVSPATIASNSFLIGLKGEAADKAVEPGEHTLLIDPTESTLEAALEDPDVEVIQVVIDPDGSALKEPFRGFYQRGPGSTAVVRPGPGTKDVVTFESGFKLKFGSEQATAETPESVLVVTGDMDDSIRTNQSEGSLSTPMIVNAGSGNDTLEGALGNDHLEGGPGNDVYVFADDSGGDDKIFEAGNADRDRLDLREFYTTAVLDLGATTQQFVPGTTGSGLSIELSSPDGIEDVWGTRFDDTIVGNDRNNELKGFVGQDLLIGGQGNDTLLGGTKDDVVIGSEGEDTVAGEGDNDVVLGDGFDLDFPEAIAFAESLKDLFTTGAQRLSFGIALTPLTGMSDTVTGGGGDDLLIGGDGPDEIDAGSGSALIFGDAFVAAADFSLSVKDLWTSVNPTVDLLLDFDLAGNGSDTIKGGTESNVVVAGGGNDTVEGSAGGIDLLFGNDGADTIDGKDGVNFIVGGAGADPDLRGGSGVDVILGDALSFNGKPLTLPESFTPTDVLEVSSFFRQSLGFFRGFELHHEGAGNDIIDAGDGLNAVWGGGGNDKLVGGDSVDLLFGNDGNDTIEGGLGLADLIVGGDDDDELTGHAGVGIENANDGGNVIFGDNVELKLDFDLGFLVGKRSWPSLDAGIELSGEGQDSIWGGHGFDFISAGDGADTIAGRDGFNIVFGDDFQQAKDLVDFVSFVLNPIEGTKKLLKSAFSSAVDTIKEWIYGKGKFEGSEANPVDNGDRYVGGAGNDIVFGGGGDDSLFGGAGFDIIAGGGGTDTVDVGSPAIGGVVGDFGFGGPGDDTILGGTGNDLIGSTLGADVVMGDLGDDVIVGGDGDDQLFGDDGSDKLYGDGGDDTLTGGSGSDLLVGGGGATSLPDLSPEDVVPPPFIVEELTANSSGFVARFGHSMESNALNLHATVQLGPPDLLVEGPEGEVAGSLVLGPGSAEVTFIKSEGPLSVGVYNVMLRSAIDAFHDTHGQLLDGNGDGAEGDDFVTTFEISAPDDARTISLPDILRGPGQPINVPASDTAGIPVSISDGRNVGAINLQIRYDPSLIQFTGATVGEAMPLGSSVSIDTAVPGQLMLVFVSATELPAGGTAFVQLQAQVPTTTDDTYGKQQVLDVHTVTVFDSNQVAIPVVADDAIQLVSYLADVSGNKRINASDAAQVARVAALLDDGFVATPLTDPGMIGDVSGNGRINAADASLVARFAALIPVPEIPPLPTATAAGGAFPLAVPQGTPVGDDEAGDLTATAPAEASVDAYWWDTAFQRRATNLAATDESPAGGLNSDDSGTLEDAIDEFFTRPWTNLRAKISEYAP